MTQEIRYCKSCQKDTRHDVKYCQSWSRSFMDAIMGVPEPNRWKRVKCQQCDKETDL